MKIVTVIPLAKGVFKDDLTYFTAKEIQNGSIVSVPVRNKKILGVVISCEDVSESKSDIKEMSFNLKKVFEVKEQSIFAEEFLNSGIEISNYFVNKTSMVLLSLIPTAFRENYDAIKITPSAFSHSPLAGGEKKELNIRSEKKLFQAPRDERISFYKTLIRETFAMKKSLFMILPSERDIEIFQNELSRGIEQFTFSINSKMSEKKQIEVLNNILNTEHSVFILATPQYLSIPRNDIDTIIVENESANSYKMFTYPYLDFRTFIEVYAQNTKTKLILADTILRFETLGRREEFSEIRPLSFRLNFGGEIKLPKTEEINTTPSAFGHSPLAGGEKSGFKLFFEENIEEIKQTLERKQNVFVFSLRKGLATQTVCQDCKEILMCDECSAPIVLYLSRDGKKRMFICNRCSTEKETLMTCPNCESWNLTPLGIGTDTVSEELEKYFPKDKIFKIDKTIAKTEKGAEKIVKDFEKEKGAILIGTEMAFFYMKEPVSLSVISSFDSLWSIPNFKMSEKIIHIIFSLINITRDKIIIQTKNEKDDCLVALKNDNLLNFVRDELQDRKNLDYPPYKRFIKITHTGNREDTIVAKKYLTDLFEGYDVKIFSAFISRIKGQYVTNTLIKIEPIKWSLPQISLGSHIDKDLSKKLYSLSREFTINVDPEDLL